jgi:hypothetical protein
MLTKAKPIMGYNGDGLDGERGKVEQYYDREPLPTRDYETRRHRHYNRQRFRVDEQAAKENPLEAITRDAR